MSHYGLVAVLLMTLASVKANDHTIPWDQKLYKPGDVMLGGAKFPFQGFLNTDFQISSASLLSCVRAVSEGNLISDSFLDMAGLVGCLLWAPYNGVRIAQFICLSIAST